MKHFRNGFIKFLKNIVPVIILLGVGIGLCYGAALKNSNTYQVSFYHVKSQKVKQNTRIVFISDLHLQEYGYENQMLLSNIENLKPDMIILGGDLVTRGTSNYNSMLNFCNKLSDIAPTYGVPGNHEDEMRYLDGDEEIYDCFRQTGICYLVNETAQVEIKKSKFEICGIRGNLNSYNNYGGKALMDKLENTNSFRIVIAHIPYLYKNGLESYDYDLAFAGHTHGGIVRLPSLGGLYSAEEGFLPEYTEGIQTLPNGASLIISRGMGDSSNVVPRINNRHELCVIDITEN